VPIRLERCKFVTYLLTYYSKHRDISQSIVPAAFGRRERLLLKSKGKCLSTFYSAAYMRRLANRSALQSWKWQVIGMS